MVRTKYFLFLSFAIVCFSACKKSENIEVADPSIQFSADTTAIRAFVKANNIPAIKDSYGVFYQIIEPGSGSVMYNSTTRITSDYEGRLLNGNIFDSSKGTPITFALGGVIAGWQIGIQRIQQGGKIRLIIPSYYGYGTQAVGGIPANSPLDFTISLTQVSN